MFSVAASRGRSLPPVSLSDGLSGGNWCLSRGNPHPSAESDFIWSLWASSSSPVGQCQGTCCILGPFVAYNKRTVHVCYMEAAAPHRHKPAQQFWPVFRRNSARSGTRTREEAQTCITRQYVPDNARALGRLQAADAQASSSLAPCQNCGPKPGVPCSHFGLVTPPTRPPDRRPSLRASVCSQDGASDALCVISVLFERYRSGIQMDCGGARCRRSWSGPSSARPSARVRKC